MKKKITAIALVVCMLAIAIAGATMAYFTDTESANNVMTVGKIDIEQHEQEADGSEFEQDKTLLPNVQVDKIVTIENVGNADAYFRTFVAFEGTKEFVDTYLDINKNPGLEQYGEIQIGSGIYTLYIYVHPGKLAADETSDAILTSFTLKPEATQEDVAFAGDVYNVWVVTEAVQADGFDVSAGEALNTAFGVLGAQATADPYEYIGYHPFGDTSWYSDTATEYTLTDRADLLGFANLVNGGTSFSGKTVNIDADIDLSGIEWAPLNLWNPEKAGMTINGNGHTISNLSVDGGSKIGFIGSYAGTGDMVIKNLTFKKAEVVTSGSHAAVVIGYQYGHVTMDKVTVTNSTVESTNNGINHAALVGFSAQNDGAVLDVVNCTITKNTISGFHGVGTVVGKSASDFDSKFSVNGTTITDNTLYYTATGGKGGHEVGAGSYGYVDAAYTGTGNTFKNNKILWGTTSVEGKNLATALANAQPGDIITLTSAPTETVTISGELEDVTINAAGFEAKLAVAADAELTDVTITSLNSTSGQAISVANGADVNNLTISNSSFSNHTGTPYGAIGLSEKSATVTIENCVFDTVRYAVYYSGGGWAGMTIKDCTFMNVNSWAIQGNGGTPDNAVLTIDGCVFDGCKGGIAKYLSSANNITVNFTNNTLTNCAGHDGKDTAWFALKGTGTVTVSGNTLDGAEWTPGSSQGLNLG